MNCLLLSAALVSLPVHYWGLDHRPHTGIIVVNKKIAPQVQTIFQKIYETKFPIAKIKPLSDYGNNEEKAMEDNDTFAYSCRPMTGSETRLSKHAYGMAIDINPLFNPYVKGNIVLPNNAENYINRNQNQPGMIKKDDAVYNIFISEGWRWGGGWRTRKDYQHFEY